MVDYRIIEDLMKSNNFTGNNMDRRHFFKKSGQVAGAALGLTLASAVTTHEVKAAPKFTDYPFTLGVASGDPDDNGFVIWTRLAPEPLKGGGMPDYDIPVKWEVAKDESFEKIISEGTEFARADLGHSVHVEVEGLNSNEFYFYRFKCGGQISPVGRSKTFPETNEQVASMTFAFASCQQYEHGYYTAYRHMSEEDLDFVIHLGDYIYEYGPNEYVSKTGNVRSHNSPEIKSLDDYRNRYAQYKSDKDLQRAHAAFPWIVTWDDHEVENNYADEIPEDGQSIEDFVKRRAAAYQAYYEHMPLRRTSIPHGIDLQLFRRFSYGKLANFHVLDTRQYRDNQANGDGIKPPSSESMDPNRTVMGFEQEKWLEDGLINSNAKWDVIAQQIFFAQLDFSSGPDVEFNMDAWDGYSANRDRIIDYLGARKDIKPIVLTGDVHASWCSEIKEDFNESNSRTIGAEFVGTSITSGGNGSDIRGDTHEILEENPHIKFFNDYRGYVRCHVTSHTWQTDYRVIPYVTRPGAKLTTRASFVFDRNKMELKKHTDQPIKANHKSGEKESERIKAQEEAAKKQRTMIKN